MATGPKKGLSMAKKIGSGPNNGGFDTYDIASGYATSIFTGDPVKIVAGKIQKAVNGDTTVGVFDGCNYTAATGTPVQSAYWTASTVPSAADRIAAKVLNDPFYTFLGVADGTLAQVAVGNIYALNLDAGSTFSGLSGATIKVLASYTSTASLPATGSATLVGNVASIANNDAFTIKASSNAGAATTITILTATTRDQFMAALNAVANISATITSDLKLKIQATDGTSLVLTDGTGTPLADFGGTIGTVTPTVAANAGLVKVQSIVDPVTRVLEVSLVNQANL